MRCLVVIGEHQGVFVRIDEARQQRGIAELDDLRSGSDDRAITDGDDLAILYQDDGVFDRFAAAPVDQAIGDEGCCRAGSCGKSQVRQKDTGCAAGGSNRERSTGIDNVATWKIGKSLATL